ncbi:MAG: hypothetical protein QHH15_07880, partial [Candidatus Thermoplasmatota archaeon]|nr:hypothetical protein [Candidatus Thermoplasmatota archaeon]
AEGYYFNRILDLEPSDPFNYDILSFWESPKIDMSPVFNKNACIYLGVYAKSNSTQRITINIKGEYINGEPMNYWGIDVPINLLNYTGYNDFSFYNASQGYNLKWIQIRFRFRSNDPVKTPILFKCVVIMNITGEFIELNETFNIIFECPPTIFVNYSANITYISDYSINISVFNYNLLKFDEIEIGIVSDNKYYNFTCMIFNVYFFYENLSSFDLTIIINFTLNSFLFHKYAEYNVNISYITWINETHYYYESIKELSFWYKFENENGFLEIYLNNTLNQTLTKPELKYSQYGSVSTRFTQFWLNITKNNYQNITIRFYIHNLTIFDYFLVEILEIKRFEIIIDQPYRLESAANRQRYDVLEFQSEFQTLLIKDIFGRDIHRQEYAYSKFIDVTINLIELILRNDANRTIWFTFEITPYISINFGVPAGSWRSIVFLLGDYYVTIEDTLRILDVRLISITSVNKTTLVYAEVYEFPKPPTEWWRTGNKFIDLFIEAFVFMFSAEGFLPWGLLFSL